MLKEHDQGDDTHLTEAQRDVFIEEATRTTDGLMPAGILFEGTWVDPPRGSNKPGRSGMRAFDDDYFYYCMPNGQWRRAPLESW